MLAKTFGCRIELAKTENEVSLVNDDAGRSISLFSSNTPLVKWNLRDFATRHILGHLRRRIGPDDEGNYGRKDLVGITSVIDTQRWRSLLPLLGVGLIVIVPASPCVLFYLDYRCLAIG